MSRRNFYSSLAVFAFFAAFYALAGDLNAQGSYWPKLICVAGGALSALNALLAALKMRKEPGGVRLFPLTWPQLKCSLSAVAIVVLWLAAVPVIGYLFSSILATLALVLLFEPLRDKRHFIRDAVVTVVFSFAVYQLFSVLEVYFPESLLF